MSSLLVTPHKTLRIYDGTFYDTEWNPIRTADSEEEIWRVFTLVKTAELQSNRRLSNMEVDSIIKSVII